MHQVGSRRARRAPFWIIFAAALAGPPAAQAAQSPIVARLVTQDYVVEADGTYVLTTHVEFLATNDSAAREAAQQTLRYSDQMEELEVVEAYTEKADGTRLPVAESAMFTQVPQGAPNLPAFNDQKQRVIVFPSVAAGDAVVYTMREHVHHPMFPGHFAIGDSLPTGISVLENRNSILAPKSMPLHTEGHGITFTVEERGDQVAYLWNYAAPDAVAEDLSLLSTFDRGPRFFVSSFRDYDAFAEVYRQLATPLVEVTAEIRALAGTITAGASEPRDKAERIYNWVSANIRYVAVHLGRGAVVPHDAGAVIANGYGDCKDHTVVFSALLKAAGIDSEIVLVNLDNAYTLSEKPTLTQINHAISYIPSLDLYLDSTAGMAPFGSLPFQEYGKQAVHVQLYDVPSADALRRIPVLAAGGTEVTVRTVTRVEPDGALAGETETVATGPYSMLLRTMGEIILSRGPENAAAGQLQSLGVPGTGSFELAPPQPLEPSYRILGTFRTEPNLQVLAGGAFGMPGGLRLIETTGDLLMGPLWNTRLPDTEPTPCFTGHTHETLTLEFPAGKRLAALPADTDIANAHLTFTVRWSQTDGSVTVERDFTATSAEPLCTGDIRKEAAAALAAIRLSYAAQLALVDR